MSVEYNIELSACSLVWI